MKRLLKVSFDTALFSFIPILQWFLLSLIVDKNLINIFSLVYPIQFILCMIKSIFSTGANINKVKDKNKDAVMSGLMVGSIIGLLIFGFLVLNVEKYISFMNMDVNTYKNFTMYYFIQLYLQLIFSFILEKLYYENKNTIANVYSLIFNFLNISLLVIGLLFIKNEMIVITITLFVLFIFVLYISIKNSDKFKVNIDLFKFIKYNSVDLVNNIIFFFIFLFGLSNAMDFGEQYALAITFVALITDTQWDAADSISTIAKIDISKGNFNYNIHKKNAYNLIFILFSTTLIMFITLYRFYDLNIILTFIYLGFEIINFIIYPIYRLKTCYLQLEYSALKITSNKVISGILRFFISLVKSPFCTGLGQVTSSIYQFITVGYLFHQNYLVDKDGYVKKKI